MWFLLLGSESTSLRMALVPNLDKADYSTAGSRGGSWRSAAAVDQALGKERGFKAWFVGLLAKYRLGRLLLLGLGLHSLSSRILDVVF